MHYLFYLHTAAVMLLAVALVSSLLHRHRTSAALSTLSAVMYLVVLALFAAHCTAQDHSIRYIAHNMVPDETAFLRFSSLWAGREGSLLLWSGLIAAVALFFSPNAVPMIKSFFRPRVLDKDTNRGPGIDGKALYPLYAVLFLLSLINIFFSSPFHLTSDTEAYAPLNDALRSVWMIVHPPLLFAGYTFAILLFSLVLYAVRYPGHIRQQRKEILTAARLCFLFLSAGIASGGVWAYRSLGWGGFWGWDPVENASLVPWLFVLSFLHTVRRSAAKTPLKPFPVATALSVFLSAVAGVFLTRSGLLSAVSVHSFQPGGTSVPYLIVVLATAAATAWGIVRSFRNAASGGVTVVTPSMFAAQLFFVFAAVIFTLNVLPLVLIFVQDKVYTVSPEVYNAVSVFVLVVTVILLAVPSLQTWKRAALLAVLTVLAAVLLPVAGIRPPIAVLLSLLLFTILALLADRHRPAYLTVIHAGFAVFAAGIICAFALSSDTRFHIEPERLQEFKGRHFSFTTHDETLTLFMDTRMKRISVSETDRPVIFPALFADYYVTVIKYLDSMEITGSLRLSEDTPVRFEDYTVIYTGYDNGTYTVHITDNGSTTVVSLTNRNRTGTVSINGGSRKVSLNLAGPDNEWIMLWIEPDPSRGLLPPILVLDVSRKPLMVLVYTGILMILGGSAAAMWKGTDDPC